VDQEQLDEEGLTAQEREIVEAKRTKHKRVAYFKFDDYGLVVLRPPTQKEAGAFQSEISDERQSSALAGVNYVRDCVVYPEDPIRVSTLLDDYPVWVQGPAGIAVNELGGAGVGQLNKSTRKGPR
jgi:hypothetical protein